MWLTGYGTAAPIEDVVAFYQDLGFEGQGGPGGEQGLQRWVGTREGDSVTWRKVDVATGPVAGRPAWATAFEVMAPHCGSQESEADTEPAFALPGPMPGDRVIARDLIRFARSPTTETLADLPLAPTGVWLGLGDRLLVKRSAEQLADPDAWVLEADRFRAYAGPFSTLDLLARRRRTAVSVGPHPHCASPPMPPPPRVADLRRVSIQPRDRESCLQWWTVDLFLTGDEEIAAVTLDLWEP